MRSPELRDSKLQRVSQTQAQPEAMPQEAEIERELARIRFAFWLHERYNYLLNPAAALAIAEDAERFWRKP